MAREKDECYTNQSVSDVFKNVGEIGDPCHARGLRHPMYNILMTALLGFLCGCNSYRGIYRFFHPEDPLKRAELQRQLEVLMDLKHGVPHYSTASRRVAALDPDVLVTMTADFMASLLPESLPEGEKHFCLDGKAIRASLNKSRAGNNFYIVNVVMAGTYLFLNQIAVGPKRQEGKVIEDNIVLLLNGQQGHCTMDAMGTKKTIVDMLCGMGCDATLPVKKNNDNLRKGILTFLEQNVENAPELVSHIVDLNNYTEQDAPSDVIVNTVTNVYEEDNRQAEDGVEEVPRPLQTLSLFDGLYGYRPFSDLEAIQAAELDKTHSQLHYVKVGDQLVKMVSSHGRLERREVELITDPDAVEAFLIANNTFGGWSQVTALGQVTRYRGEQVRDPETKKMVWNITVTRTPYITTANIGSIEYECLIREHWNIENWHRVLDTVFLEDQCTTRKGSAPENLSCLRKLAANLVVVEMAAKRPYEERFSSGLDSESHLKGFVETMATMKMNIRSLCGKLLHRIRSPYKKAQ